MNAERRLFSGVSWGTLSMLIVAGSQIAFLAVLSRLLTPAEFGLVALGNLCLRFLSYFSQLGITPAVVQKPNLGQDDIAAAMAVSLGISALCGVGAAIAAPLAARFFDMALLGPVVMVMALNFPIQGLSGVAIGLLRRRTQFRALGIIDVTAYLTGYGAVGIPMAWSGHGVWSLVAASIAQNTTSTLLSLGAARQPLRIRHRREARQHFLSYGSRYSLIGFVEFVSNSLDALFIGKVLGDAAAGVYNRASTLASLPVQQPVTVLTRALFPILSGAELSTEKQAIGLQLSVLAVGLFSFTASAALVAAAPDVVNALLGPQWHEATLVLQLFALSIGPRYLTHSIGVSLDAIGALGPKLRVQTTLLVMMAIAIGATVRHGVAAVALAVSVGEFVRAGLLLWVFARARPSQPGQWTLTLAFVMAAWLLTATFVTLALWLLPRDHAAVLGLVVATAASGLSLLTLLQLGHGPLRRIAGVGWLLQRLPRLGRMLPPTAALGTLASRGTPGG